MGIYRAKGTVLIHYDKSSEDLNVEHSEFDEEILARWKEYSEKSRVTYLEGLSVLDLIIEGDGEILLIGQRSSLGETAGYLYGNLHVSRFESNGEFIEHNLLYFRHSAPFNSTLYHPVMIEDRTAFLFGHSNFALHPELRDLNKADQDGLQFPVIVLRELVDQEVEERTEIYHFNETSQEPKRWLINPIGDYGSGVVFILDEDHTSLMCLKLIE